MEYVTCIQNCHQSFTVTSMMSVLIPRILGSIFTFSKRNVLVSRTGDCLLCDFGLSRIRHEISRTHTTIHQGGRQRFIAPEISSGLEARIKSDVYSLAMTIYALGTMSLPFGHIDRDLAVYRAVQEGERPPPCDSLGGLAAEETVHLWSLIERMWKQDPDCRPTVPSARDEMMQIGPLAGLDPDQVRPDLKKEGSDWWAIFSPRVPRVLDVSLSLTLQHERCVFFVLPSVFATDVLRDVHPPTPGTVLCAVFVSQQMASTLQQGAIAWRKYTIQKQVLECGVYFHQNSL